jgi:cell division protein FtsL
MTAESFEWAIKKDVRNNPIVREVDRERHREMWRAVWIGGFLVAVLLFTVWQQFQLLQYGYRMELMQQQYAEEQEIQRHLRLEIEALRSPARIEQVATKELHMVAPGPADATVIERVVETTAPPRSVVVRRQTPSRGAEAPLR